MDVARAGLNEAAGAGHKSAAAFKTPPTGNRSLHLANDAGLAGRFAPNDSHKENPMLPRRLVSLIAVAAALVACVSQPSGCQSQPDSVKAERAASSWSIGALSVQVGPAQLGLDDFNANLTANGRPGFGNDVRTFGLSGYARFGRLTIGGSTERSMPQRNAQGGWISKVSFGSAMVDAGMVLAESKWLTVHPQVSLGLRTSSLSIEQEGDFTYESGVQDPARSVSLSSKSMLAGASVVAEMHFETRMLGKFSLGVRAGIVSPLGTATTSAGESVVSGTPVEQSGRYMRLTIGKSVGRRGDVVSALGTALLSIVNP
jgi:hypothetical protein